MDPLPRGMEHVDRRELYMSLSARVAYLHEFLEFGPDDVEALIEGQKYIKMLIPPIVNMVFRKLLKYDITARVFSNRDSRIEENPESFVSEESSAMQHRKMFLRWYLTKLNSDPTKMEYWEYLDKVGLMHFGGGRRNPLHVDYVFLGACLGYIQDAMMESILSLPNLPLTRKIALVKAVNKVIWIQNDLLARWHVRDGDEYVDAAHEEKIEAQAQEPEGYLHGKKILGDGVSSSGAEDASIHTNGTSNTSGSRKTILGRDVEDIERPMQCPFSGLAIGDQRAEMIRQSPKGNMDERRTSPLDPRSVISPAPDLQRRHRSPFGSIKLKNQALTYDRKYLEGLSPPPTHQATLNNVAAIPHFLPMQQIGTPPQAARSSE